MRSDFSKLVTKEFPLIGPDGNSYVLRGASAAAAVAYRNANARAQKLVDGKLVAMDNVGDSEPLLVSMCLCVADANGKAILNQHKKPTYVSEETIRSWDVEVMHEMYEWITDNSPGLVTRSLESLVKERDLINARIKELQEEGKVDPKELPKSGAVSSS